MSQKKSRNKPISAARKEARQLAEITKAEQCRTRSRSVVAIAPHNPERPNTRPHALPSWTRKKPFVQKIGTKVADTHRILAAEAKRDRRKSRNRQLAS